jgi:glycosyltransferase involved in cell wall biosynthesis
MISVLVPVYNTDVRKLATTLSAQAVHLPQPVEIIMLDDGSDNETLRINEEITSNSLVKYYQNGRNAGRINARSKLASMAAHNWLMFLDDDSRIEDGRFLEKYLGSLADERTILAGGRTYDIARPLLCKYVLHWKYGTERESKWRSAPGKFKRFSNQ